MRLSGIGFVIERPANWRVLVFWLSAVAVLRVAFPSAVLAQIDVALQKRTILVPVPADRSLPIPPPESALEAGSDVLNRIRVAQGSSRLAEMDFIVQTGSGPSAFAVTVLRNGLRGQRILLKQADGKPWSIGVGPVDPLARRILDFVQTQHERGLANLLQTAIPNAVVLDAGTKDGVQMLVVPETDGGATRYIIDSAASRVTRFEFHRGRSPDALGRPLPNLESYVFSDFRTVDGLSTPFKVEHYINGARQEELQFASVRYIAANRDEAPEAVKAGRR